MPQIKLIAVTKDGRLNRNAKPSRTESFSSWDELYILPCVEAEAAHPNFKRFVISVREKNKVTNVYLFAEHVRELHPLNFVGELLNTDDLPMKGAPCLFVAPTDHHLLNTKVIRGVDCFDRICLGSDSEKTQQMMETIGLNLFGQEARVKDWRQLTRCTLVLTTDHLAPIVDNKPRVTLNLTASHPKWEEQKTLVIRGHRILNGLPTAETENRRVA